MHRLVADGILRRKLVKRPSNALGQLDTLRGVELASEGLITTKLLLFQLLVLLLLLNSLLLFPKLLYILLGDLI